MQFSFCRENTIIPQIIPYSFWLYAAYMCQWIGSALVQIMACRFFSAKPLSKPSCVIVNWTLRIKLQWNFNPNFTIGWPILHWISETLLYGTVPLPLQPPQYLFATFVAPPRTAWTLSSVVHLRKLFAFCRAFTCCAISWLYLLPDSPNGYLVIINSILWWDHFCCYRNTFYS